MKTEDFEYLRDLLKGRSGLVLTPEKAYLIESRLMPVARKRSIKDLDALVFEMKTKRSEDLFEEVTDAMTTNESFFFRDVKPFDQFRDVVLPRLIETRAAKKSFRIWSAACSSGQEPYSLSMILKEAGAQLAGWNIEIIASDLSGEMLEKAKSGLYSQFEVQRGLPIQLMMKYFTQNGDKWRVDPALGNIIKFQPFNLLKSPASLGRFDVVFCRNVLIYFDQETKGQVLGRIAQQMPGDGVLYLGGAETVIGITDRFAPVPGRRGLYSVLPPGGGAPVGGGLIQADPK